MPPDESPEVTLVRMDGRLAVVEEALRELRQDVRGGFAALSFVRVDVYEEKQRAVREYAEETRKIAENARSVAWANAGLLLTAVMVLLAVIKAVAG